MPRALQKPKRGPRALGRFILRHLERNKMIQADLVGMGGKNSGQISKYIQGSNKFPPKLMGDLTLKLHLDAAEQTELHWLVNLSAAPAIVEDQLLLAISNNALLRNKLMRLGEMPGASLADYMAFKIEQIEERHSTGQSHALLEAGRDLTQLAEDLQRQDRLESSGPDDDGTGIFVERR